MTNPWLFVAAYLSAGVAFTAYVKAKVDLAMDSAHPNRPTLAIASVMQRNMPLFIMICLCFWFILWIESFRKKGQP